jgi:hypothetical protein
MRSGHGRIDTLAIGDVFVDYIDRNCRKRRNQSQFQITDSDAPRNVEVLVIVIGFETHVLVLPFSIFSTREWGQAIGN